MNVCFGRGDASEGIAADECLFASVEKGEVLSVELKCFKIRIV